jgi:hypothetical protein
MADLARHCVSEKLNVLWASEHPRRACFGGDVDDMIGCQRCYPEELPPDFLVYRGGLDTVESVVDESHFTLQLLQCHNCGQLFVKVFTEFIDWHGGEDAQFWTVTPITSDEATRLIAEGDDVDLQWLGSLGRGRRSLISDYPTRAPSRYAWRSGPVPLSRGEWG